MNDKSRPAAVTATGDEGATTEMVCGPCGAPWQDGMTCGQKDNGHSFPTCYPVPAAPETKGGEG